MTQGRVALVTGSSRGLGQAIARRLARDGLAVAVNGLHGDGQAAEVARAIHDDGGTAEAFTADVTDEQQVARLVTAVAARLGPVDVLVLNATGRHRAAPPYATAKNAQIGLARSWARELAPAGITVNTVAPASSPSSGTPTSRPRPRTPTSPPWAAGWELLRTSPAR